MLAGPDAEALAAKAYGRPLVVAHVRDLDNAEVMAEAALIAALEERPIVFEGMEDLEPADRARMLRAIERRGERVVVCAPNRNAALALGDRTFLLVEAAAAELRRARDRLGAGLRHATTRATSPPSSGSRSARSSRPRRSPSWPPRPAARRSPSPPSSTSAHARPRPRGSGELATRIPPGFTLGRPRGARPPARAAAARSAPTCATATGCSPSGATRRRVARTQGLKVLFAGESGTGKTMAAQVLAAELGLELFRVDLATIVSKYIGETEKNLDRIFNAAEGSNAILFFDEADALFGKRSEISDSHDRYANIEVAYLLQQMEGYPGAVILATNYRRNIDDAFVRRLDFVIDYPFPEADDRRAHLGARAARHGAARRRHRPRASSPRTSSSPAARSRTARWPPRSRPPTTAT